MTYFYDKRIERLEQNGKIYSYGICIKPNGILLDVDSYSSTQGGLFILPFFKSYIHPNKEAIKYSNKETNTW